MSANHLPPTSNRIELLSAMGATDPNSPDAGDKDECQQAAAMPAPQIAPRKLTKPVKWHGGKDYLAPRIIEEMPPHTHFVELYDGGLSVLIRKDGEGISEVINDLNGELMNFWKTLQREKSFAKFQRRIEATPFSQAEFLAAVENTSQDPLDRAVAFFIRMRQSRQGLGRDFANYRETVLVGA